MFQVLTDNNSTFVLITFASPYFLLQVLFLNRYFTYLALFVGVDVSGFILHFTPTLTSLSPSLNPHAHKKMIKPEQHHHQRKKNTHQPVTNQPRAKKNETQPSPKLPL